ncbi:hypothetical protein BDV26DRAFT_282637 [Aspergillus bertholletiae]|uniref:Uncharacterized protein n=1 Tax=Aspergillus bertholletiae TaxID=1226010 RepID=A0A5N7B326_9EURO|nr:hypothetical protein BDV26DRAFT_282637 [Aspergillus bertholletiae]
MNPLQEHETVKLSICTSVMWYIKLNASVRFEWVSKVLHDHGILTAFCLFYSDRQGTPPDEPPSKDEADQRSVDDIQDRLNVFYQRNPHMKTETVKWYVVEGENKTQLARVFSVPRELPRDYETGGGGARVTTNDNSLNSDTYSLLLSKFCHHQSLDHHQANSRLERGIYDAITKHNTHGWRYVPPALRIEMCA